MLVHLNHFPINNPCRFHKQNEMASLKADNQRLQKMVGPAASQEAAKAAATAVEKRLSIGDPGPALGKCKVLDFEIQFYSFFVRASTFSTSHAFL